MNLNFITYMNLVLYIILGLGVLIGFLRGMKKTLFTFVTMLIFYIVFFLSINQAAQALWTAQLPWLSNLLSGVFPSVGTFTSFQEKLPEILQSFMGSSVDVESLNPEVLVLANGIGIFAMKIIYSVLYFTVILLAYKLICLIIRALIFGKDKDHSSKNRGFGALFGLANGVLNVFVTLVLLGGMMSVVESMTTFSVPSDTTPLSFDFNRSQLNELSYSVLSQPIPLAASTDSQATMDALQAMVDDYNNNLIVKAASAITVTVTGTEEKIPLHLSLFDRVLSFDYNEQTISFRYELSVFSQALTIVMESDYATTQNLSSITGDEIRDAFAVLSNSKLLISLLPLSIEVASDYYDKTLPISTNDLYAMDFQEELTNLGSIAGTLFDIMSSTGLISEEGTGTLVEVDGDMIRNVFTDISDSSLMLLVTESILVPMLEESEGGLSNILASTPDLDWSQEYIAIGNVFGAMVDAGVSISDLSDADPTVLLNAASTIDLTLLMDSQILTNLLINALTSTDNEMFSMLVVPDGIVWEDTLDGFGNITENGELRNLLMAINSLNLADLTNPSAFDITPQNIFDADMDIVLSSSIFQATISQLILNNADSDQSGSSLFVIPDFFRETIIVNSMSEEQINKAELISLFASLEVLGITEFDSGVDASSITSMDDADLTILLASGSMQVTIDKILKDNSFITIPDEATTTLFGMNNITTVNEIKAFIKAVSTMSSGDISNIQFSLSSIEALSAPERNIVLDSMIVRSQISSDIVTLCTINPLDVYVLTNADYEGGNPSSFLLKSTILDVFTHYGI